MIRVAGYCRVSTDKADQANSFVAQQRYFKEYIERNPDWELYKVYADEGITGTSTKKRIQFNRMMQDAHSNCFQMIITKEVSRFSRNILDAIAYTRALRNLGIGVFFLNDGFCTLDADAELRLSIMGSLAQEESRKTSERVRWGQTRQMEQGIVFGTSLLGYDVQNGILSVNSDGAQIVRQIFYQYGVEKKSTTEIAKELAQSGLVTPAGSRIWRESYILKILKNEKYVGDLIQKKTFTPDYLTHEKKYNHGSEKKIILRDHHEPIISRDLWEIVQKEIAIRRRTSCPSQKPSNRYIFSGKIICSECGSRFIARTKRRKDGSSYRRWGCSNAVRNGKKRTDLQGRALGCDIGKYIPDELMTDMLCYIVQNLEIDRHKIADFLNAISQKAVRNDNANNPKKLEQSMQKIRRKKTKAMDLLVSGLISQDEFCQIKKQYDEELNLLNKSLQKSLYRSDSSCNENIIQKIEDILGARIVSEAYLKMLLDSAIVHRDGIVEIKLNYLDTVWKFQIYNE